MGDENELKTDHFGFGKLRALWDQEWKPTKREIAEFWPEAQHILDFLGRHLPKQKLVKAVGILSDARKRRFLRCRVPKYGSMNKGFTEDELVLFLKTVNEPKIVLLFTFQAVLGLRIGEAVKLHICDINLEERELRIGNEKSDRADYLPIPPQLFEQTLNFISENEAEISSHKGYLFWAERYPKKNPCPHVSKDFVRQLFREAVKRAKLNETYGLAESRTPKLLHRLTTHSLRHYAITNFSRRNNGNVVLTSRFAKHNKIETTMTYVHTEKEELYRSVMLSQDGGVLERVRRMQLM